MTREDSIRTAAGLAASYRIPPEYVPRLADLRIVEIVANQPVADALPGPGPVIDRIAWVVRFEAGNLWVELTLDDQTRKVIRYRRSRGTASMADTEAQ